MRFGCAAFFLAMTVIVTDSYPTVTCSAGELLLQTDFDATRKCAVVQFSGDGRLVFRNIEDNDTGDRITGVNLLQEGAARWIGVVRSFAVG